MLRGRSCFNGIVLNARARISAPIKDMRQSKGQVLWQPRAGILSVSKYHK